jgi:hypothetical protein
LTHRHTSVRRRDGVRVVEHSQRAHAIKTSHTGLGKKHTHTHTHTQTHTHACSGFTRFVPLTEPPALSLRPEMTVVTLPCSAPTTARRAPPCNTGDSSLQRSVMDSWPRVTRTPWARAVDMIWLASGAGSKAAMAVAQSGAVSVTVTTSVTEYTTTPVVIKAAPAAPPSPQPHTNTRNTRGRGSREWRLATALLRYDATTPTRPREARVGDT